MEETIFEIHEADSHYMSMYQYANFGEV